MPPIAILFLAGSAVIHAAWNIRLKGTTDPERAAATAVITPGLIAGVAIITVWAIGGVAISVGTLLLGGAAGFAELVYFMTLARAYAGAPISVVYPLVRGINPLMAVLIGTTLLGETLHGGQPYGIALAVAGLFVIQPPWQGLRAGTPASALGFAVAAGLLSATGSAIERIGVLGSGPIEFLCITWGITSLLYLLVAQRQNDSHRPTPVLALTGSMIILGHLLVMAAFAVAPLSIVIPLRESAILLVSGWGILRMRETQSRQAAIRRGIGAVIILVGAVAIALG
jgi:multidrug transporter EmrE-like cation transporter